MATQDILHVLVQRRQVAAVARAPMVLWLAGLRRSSF